MVTEERIWKALENVKDPELGISIVRLGMVKKVSANGGKVAVDVALTISGCPLREKVEKDVTEAVSALDGVGLGSTPGLAALGRRGHRVDRGLHAHLDPS